MIKRNILGYRCKKCGTLQYPNRTLCKKCAHNEFVAEPLPHDGTLLTWTRVHNLAVDFDVPYLTIGIVQLDNDLKVMGQLEIAEPASGMKVRGRVGPVRKGEYKTSYGFIFAPA